MRVSLCSWGTHHDLVENGSSCATTATIKTTVLQDGWQHDLTSVSLKAAESKVSFHLFLTPPQMQTERHTPRGVPILMTMTQAHLSPFGTVPCLPSLTFLKGGLYAVAVCFARLTRVLWQPPNWLLCPSLFIPICHSNTAARIFVLKHKVDQSQKSLWLSTFHEIKST